MASFKGTSIEQDGRFVNKQRQLLKSMEFPSHYSTRVNIEKVNLDALRPWVAETLMSMLDGLEDDVLVDTVINSLEAEKSPDPRQLQINMTAFLGAQNAMKFVGKLWNLMLDAQEQPGGLPRELVEQVKKRLEAERAERERIAQGMRLAAERDRKGIESQVGGTRRDVEQRRSSRSPVRYSRRDSPRRSPPRRNYNYSPRRYDQRSRRSPPRYDRNVSPPRSNRDDIREGRERTYRREPSPTYRRDYRREPTPPYRRDYSRERPSKYRRPSRSFSRSPIRSRSRSKSYSSRSRSRSRSRHSRRSVSSRSRSSSYSSRSSRSSYSSRATYRSRDRTPPRRT